MYPPGSSRCRAEKPSFDQLYHFIQLPFQIINIAVPPAPSKRFFYFSLRFVLFHLPKIEKWGIKSKNTWLLELYYPSPVCSKSIFSQPFVTDDRVEPMSLHP